MTPAMNVRCVVRSDWRTYPRTRRDLRSSHGFQTQDLAGQTVPTEQCHFHRQETAHCHLHAQSST